ncbi:hypothetical protein Gotur_018567, partial [Gossypium turneri]
MWRLKIGEGSNDPYLYSTAEERAEVEEARLNFYNNRYNVQPSSDLLWQMQDGEEVTYEVTTAAVKRSVHLFSALQSIHGH